MSIEARCPKNPKHKRFLTTAHVMEEWEVDEHGLFIAVKRGLQTVHGPSPDNIWDCATCRAEAIVTVNMGTS